MVYFTADHHFGHANIIEHCNRPYKTVGEMNQDLLAKWNITVKANDAVYILGDLFFRSGTLSEILLCQLNGKKHLLIGNHDRNWMKKTNLSQYFESVGHMAVIHDGQSLITMCHYPMMSWNGSARGAYMIHGHMHNTASGTLFALIQRMPNLLNAGVDINGYKPVVLGELVQNNEKFKETGFMAWSTKI